VTQGIVLRALDGVFSGAGFAKKNGRRPHLDDCNFLAGPIDVEINEQGLVNQIGLNLKSPYQKEFDGRGLLATHSFADSHTHSLYAGTRAREFFLRWQGKSYSEIAQAGGGILNTMSQTSKATDDELLSSLLQRLRARRSEGVTHVEIKTGYATNPEGELRLLRLLTQAQQVSFDVKIFRTFLGLHALPKGATEGSFVDSMIAILPTVKREGLCEFVDAFPDTGFFSLKESLRFTQAAAKLGIACRIHADELSDLGTSQAYADQGALSVDHLQKISLNGIASLAESKTIATLLPATSFFLGLEYAAARRLIDSGCAVSLATDFNPGTAPEGSIQFTARLAASQLKMSAPEILCALTLNAFASLNSQGGVIAPAQPAALALWARTSSDPHESLQSIFVDAAKPVATVLGFKITESANVGVEHFGDGTQS
jgi:imidazolonepropionase